jgi:hypothetical protein
LRAKKNIVCLIEFDDGDGASLSMQAIKPPAQTKQSVRRSNYYIAIADDENSYY